ncbi:unnamed protein product, partial [Lymnaea stagnalis]
MLSVDWLDQECLETCLQKYIKKKEFDKADLFLNLIATRPNPCILNINNSETVKKLRFEQMKLASEKMIAEEDLVDPIWKKIMDEDGENNDSVNLLDNHGMRFDVMLVNDNDSCPDVEDRLWSYRASGCMKWSIKEKCGLTVEQVQDLRIPGQVILTKDIFNIFQSKVVIFFFDGIENVGTIERHQE